MAQYRPALAPEEEENLRRWENAITWSTDRMSSPLDARGRCQVRQAFAFDIKMDDYSSTATRFVDTRRTDAAHNNFLLFLVFLYICDAYRIRTSFPAHKPEDDSDEDEDEDGGEDRLEGDIHEGDEDDSHVPRGSTRGRGRGRGRGGSRGSTRNKRQKVARTPEDRLQELLQICRRMKIPTEDLTDMEDIARRSEALSNRLLEHMETEMEGEDDVPQHWCAIEYVPDTEYDADDKSFIADIFNDDDPYYAFNNMLIRKRARHWTFHFLTTSRFDFNRELGVLLKSNMLSQFQTPESTVSLSYAQRINIDHKINNASVAGSDDNLNNKRPKKRKRTETSLALADTDGSPRASKSTYVLYPWRKYQLVDPMTMVHLATNYLHIDVYGLYHQKRWPISPVIPYGSAMHACNIFSVGIAISQRSMDVSVRQSLLEYDRQCLYFNPSDDNRVTDEQGRPVGDLYYWTAPHPGRLIFPRIENIRPANVVIREFPDQTILSRNPFQILYPAFMSGKVSTAFQRRVFTGDASNNSEVVNQEGKKAGSSKPCFPSFPEVAGMIYRDIPMLRSKISISETALRENTVRRHAGASNYADRIKNGQIFSAADLERAKAELAKFQVEFEDYSKWFQAKNNALARYAETSREFVGVMMELSRKEHETAVRMDKASVRAALTPPTVFSISDYLSAASNSCQNYEIFNTLRDRNRAFYKLLRPFLDDRSNGLTDLERCGLYKLYQMYLTRSWSMMARGSDSFLPDAGRAIYKYIETNKAYEVQRRPRNVLRKLDQDMDILSNTLAWFQLHYRRTLDAARPDLLQLAVLTSYDSSRPTYDIHLNMCFVGDGGVAKSWTFTKATELRIPGTYIEITGETAAANRNNSGSKENWNVMVHHEIEQRRFIGENEGGVGDPVIKQILDRCVSITRTVILDRETNEVKNAVRIMERVGINYWCANFKMDKVHNSMFDRMIVITMPPNDRIVTSIISEQTKHKENEEHYQTQLVLHRFLQALVHEVWMAIGLEIMPAPSATLLFLAMHFINERMMRAGIRPFRPREILKFRLLGCNLVILNAIVTNFLIQGGRYYNMPVTAESIVSLAPQLYMTSTQVIQTIKILSPYFIMQGEDVLREALKFASSVRYQATNSIRACYATLEVSRNRKPTQDYGATYRGERAERELEESMGGYGGNHRDHEGIDWNYQKFQLTHDELMNYVKTREGGDRLTGHTISMAIKELCCRNIKTRPYINPMNNDSSHPVLAEPKGFEDCPCTNNESDEVCKDHAPREIPIMMKRRYGQEEVLLVSTAWLMQIKSDSAETVIHDALYDFFNHRYQPSICCTAGYSERFPGTFDVFKLDAPSRESDQRPVLMVPNMHQLTDHEHKFMHERGTTYENADQVDTEKDDFDRDFWTAEMFVLDQSFDDYAALARRSILYPYNEKITMRDLVKVLYGVGYKLGWVDKDSPLSSVKYNPDDPLFERYDDTEDLDVPDSHFMVPSAEDPTKQVLLRDELGMSLREFKMMVATPECIEARQDMVESRLNRNTMTGKYPQDTRASLQHRDRNMPPPTPPVQALIQKTMSLTKQLNARDEDITSISDSRNVLTRKRADLRRQLLNKKTSSSIAASPGRMDVVDNPYYEYLTPEHIHCSPSNYSPRARTLRHESPYRDALDPTTLSRKLRSSLLANSPMRTAYV